MKKILLFFFLAVSVFCFGQDSVEDSSLYVPYKVTVNHDTLQNRILEMARKERFDDLLRIFETPGFANFIVVMENKWGIIKDRNSVVMMLAKTVSEMPDKMSEKPTSVIEDNDFGDRSRIEIWDYVDKNGAKKDFRVTFINGQITNFLVWL